VIIVQAYQTSQYVMPRSGIFLGKWRSSFTGISDGKIMSNQPAPSTPDIFLYAKSSKIY
jgi:hypothetical protein